MPGCKKGSSLGVPSRRVSQPLRVPGGANIHILSWSRESCSLEGRSPAQSPFSPQAVPGLCLSAKAALGEGVFLGSGNILP